jgi:hypothetical protein
MAVVSGDEARAFLESRGVDMESGMPGIPARYAADGAAEWRTLVAERAAAWLAKRGLATPKRE